MSNDGYDACERGACTHLKPATRFKKHRKYGILKIITCLNSDN